MAHQRAYDDADPFLALLRVVCATLPGSSEKEAWGRPTFRGPKKIYAVYGASPEHPTALVFKPEEDERPALLGDPRFFKPPYFGPSGWLALDLTPDVDWDEVEELLTSSYRLMTTVALLRELDGERPAAVEAGPA